MGRVFEPSALDVSRDLCKQHAETGDTKQITYGLSDAIWPVLDANGKYLWFLASNDFGLRRSGRHDIVRPRDQLRSLSCRLNNELNRLPPRCPKAMRTERARTGSAARLPRPLRHAADPAGLMRRADRADTVTVADLFDGLAKRIVSVPGGARASVLRAHRGSDGTVFYVEAAPGRAVRQQLQSISSQRSAAPSLLPRCGGFTVSCDGKKWSIAQAVEEADRWRPAGGTRPRPRCFWLMLTGRPRPQTEHRPSQLQFCGCISTPRTSTGRGSTSAGAISATISTCRTCTDGLAEMREMLRRSSAVRYHRVRSLVSDGYDGAETAPLATRTFRGGICRLLIRLEACSGPDFKIENGRYRITRIYDNENLNPDLRSPLLCRAQCDSVITSLLSTASS